MRSHGKEWHLSSRRKALNELARAPGLCCGIHLRFDSSAGGESGALDIIGFVFLATLTAVGGGTLRDLMLDRDPVFWIAHPENIAIACLAAIIVVFTAHFVESRERLMLWLDALARRALPRRPASPWRWRCALTGSSC